MSASDTQGSHTNAIKIHVP